MTETQSRRLTAGDYVASLNQRMPVGYKITRVLEAAPSARVQIQVAQLYGEDMVLAHAFHVVAGPVLTRAEQRAVNEEREAVQGIIAVENALADAAQARMECAA